MEQTNTRSDANEPARIGTATMITLGIGWFGAQVFWAFHAGSMPLFLKDFTDSKFTISLVLSLAGVSGLIIPPAAGYLSDRTSTRWGRRSPYILFGALGVMICILMLPGIAALGIVALLSACMYVCFRSAETTFLALLPDITPSEQRSTATGVMNLVGGVGLIACFVVGAVFWDEHPRLVFIIAALGCFIFMSIAVMLIEEPKALHESTPAAVGPMAYLRSVAKEVNVLKFLAAQFSWWLAFWMASTFAVLFATQELGVPEGRSFLVPMVFAIVAALFMVPLGLLGDRFNRKSVLSWVLASWMVVQILVAFSQNLTHALLTFSLCAIPYAGIMAVGYAFLFDLIPKERTAEFVGIGLVSMASGQICGPLIGGKVIDTYGYRWLFPCAALFLLIGLVLLQFVRVPASAGDASSANPSSAGTDGSAG
jgi:MFS family permease